MCVATSWVSGVSGAEQAAGSQMGDPPTKCHSKELGPCPVGLGRPPELAEHGSDGSKMIFQNI